MTEYEVLYEALSSSFGLLVKGNLSLLRKAREHAQKDDPTIATLAILGPDSAGIIWLVKRDALHEHIVT